MSVQAAETTPAATPRRGRPPAAAKAATPTPETAPVPKSRVVEHVKAQEPQVQVNAKTGRQKVVETPVQAPAERPGPSNVGADTPKLVRSIGGIIIGLGIIGAVVWWFGSDFVMMALYIALPVLIIAVALQLISWSTVQLVWNGELKERVNAYMADMDKK